MRNPKGFTLIEIMISMMILGILTMITTSTALNWVSDRRLSHACQVMISGIEYTAALSLRYQRPFQFKTSTADNSFQIIDAAPYPQSVPPERQNNTPPVNSDGVVVHPLSKNWYIIDFNQITDLKSIHILSGPGLIVFDSAGNAPYADSLYVIQAGDQKRTIQVKGISGTITVQ